MKKTARLARFHHGDSVVDRRLRYINAAVSQPVALGFCIRRKRDFDVQPTLARDLVSEQLQRNHLKNRQQKLRCLRYLDSGFDKAFDVLVSLDRNGDHATGAQR